VIVLKGDGGLLWEPGDNRSVTVPEVVPTGRVVSLECAYGYTDNMAPAVATMDEETQAELEVQEEQGTAQSSAAAAIAKTMMTMGKLASGGTLSMGGMMTHSAKRLKPGSFTTG
jgi:hypothetical protein